MKKITLLFCSLFLTAGIMSAGAQTNNQKEGEVTFSVNVHCNNCKKKIENSLPHEKGVKDLKVSVEEKTVWVKYDTEKTNKDLLQKAIVKLGYTATEKTADAVKTTSETKSCGKSKEECSKKCDGHDHK